VTPNQPVEPVEPVDNPFGDGDSEDDDVWNDEILSPTYASDVALSPPSAGTLRDLRDQNPRTSEARDGPITRHTAGNDGSRGGALSRATSCPPTAHCHPRPGPWSWEWLQDHSHAAAGVIFSAGKRNKDGSYGGRQQGVGQAVTSSRKAGGVLRHPIHNLKKIARMPSKDRGEVLIALGKCARKRRGRDQASRSNSVSCQAMSDESSAPGATNTDWQNWVAVHGNAQMAVDDVCGIGQTIGVTFRGG
jgi:hypothetical protein